MPQTISENQPATVESVLRDFYSFLDQLAEEDHLGPGAYDEAVRLLEAADQVLPNP